jgi:protein gp37
VGEASKIAWTDDTVNVWIGCDKVSPGCKHCYAESSQPVRVARAGEEAQPRREVERKGVLVTLPARPYRAPLELWGAKEPRRETKDWARNLRKWNRETPIGRARRVFAQSLSDTFEDYRGGRVMRADGRTDQSLDMLRFEFFAVVEECTALTLQLLTKRIENVERMVPPSWMKPGGWPAHVWIGCTAENQEEAERRLPHLLRIPAPVRFVSVEPQLGRVDLSHFMPAWICDSCGRFMRGRGDVAVEVDEEEASPCCCYCRSLRVRAVGISWVICGGESAQGGHAARPFDLAWARSLRDQCSAAGVAFFLKQLGSEPWFAHDEGRHFHPLRHPAGADESEWPADLCDCRAFPGQGPPDALRVYSVGPEGTDVEAGLRQADVIRRHGMEEP